MQGLTWDHPRGYGPLDELARREGGVAWARQPLEGFESTPIAELAAEYDLLVIDHPGLGDAAGSLVPMEDLLGSAELAAWRAGTIGASYDSYVLGGRTWALPIDAAAQVSAATFADQPRTWDEVLAFDGPVTPCLGGPHALLMFFSLCLAFGAEPFTDAEVGERAVEVMTELLARADTDLWQRNPIGILTAMSSGGPRYCPLVYGYVGYPTLSYSDAPAGPAGIGSVLGGTGIAVSRKADPDAARAVVRRLIAPDVQCDLFPAHGGQPADRRTSMSTFDTLERAWVRPRDPGYIRFQTEGSRLLRDGVAARDPRTHVRLFSRYQEWRHA
ncbi:type 2 periplasmic-binding domain-containing protein [Actinophytocola algeriensis]|uniref:Multiple sugar transport system substrate-binding protein n=1 Tax=Actinophytocola algeriensis TaxID=1768010 RepID=A0A7W7VF66_9PSEU|nr:carbohydrate ABC transporter substrate-binding protein [Actinophytocola algeriensis]MBB4907981.1 multiple sugar transport system substrate-binding protein [Actinophytocola algeriensis]MBE1480011.1 multiple sugar transport system substrate-binding protein [Actinophytocola algeriensis]